MILNTKNRVGLVLAGLLGVLDLGALASPTPDGEVGPPIGILVISALSGVVTVVAVVLTWWRRQPGAVRIAAGARILSMITSLPAFFVDVPSGLKVLVALFVVLTLVSVVLMLSPARRTADLVMD
ncbi:MAG: hypothetical protein ABI181_09700 [Mycobacteriaceae bacterium]